MTINDPLSRFYAEEAARTAGVKNPITGIREQHDDLLRQQTKTDEIKRKSEASKRIILSLMQNDLGREWLFDMLSICNVFGTPFAENDRLTSYNAGALYIGRLIESDIKKYALREYLQMLEEGLERSLLWDQEIGAST